MDREQYLTRFVRSLRLEPEQPEAPNYSFVYTSVLLLTLTLITLAVYETGGTKAAGPHLFYLPIVITGIVKGRIWGAATGLVSGLAIGPFMPLDVSTGALQTTSSIALRTLFFILVGYITGISSSTLSAQNRQLSERNQDLSATLEALAVAITRAIDAKHSHTGGHSQNVARYAVMLGRELGLSEDELRCLYRAGILHDIGKIAVPDTVLNKPGKLIPDEYELMKQHPRYGYDILRLIPGLRECAKLALYHHTGFDGSGYPDIVENDVVPLGARILAIADAWDAMTSDREYRNALSRDEALRRLVSAAGSQFDPMLVSRFAVLINKRQDIVRASLLSHTVMESRPPRM